jgi:Transposase DDE domain group 1
LDLGHHGHSGRARGAYATNAAWLQAVLAATDLICWTKLICFADVPALARCEIAAFRYRVLHVAGRLTRGARQTRLRIDQAWCWATPIATGFHRLRGAFT